MYPWFGIYPPAQPCPTCGRCPTCGGSHAGPYTTSWPQQPLTVGDVPPNLQDYTTTTIQHETT